MDNDLQVSSSDAMRTQGKAAQRINILAARALAETIRTTLGPKGMDKMIVNSDNSITVTNDGAAILETIRLEHPTAKMIADAAKTQDIEVGDGTTTVVVLVGEFLKNAEELLDKGIHATVLTRGFKLALDMALEKLKEYAISLGNSRKKLIDIAATAMTGKGVEESKLKLAELSVCAALSVLVNNKLEKDSLKIVAQPGASVASSQFIRGVVLDKEVPRQGMPKLVKNASLLLVDSSIEVRQTDVDSKISISSADQMERFIEMEDSMLKKMVDNISSIGANVVICQKGIDDYAMHLLETRGILAIRRVPKSDMELLAKATGAKIQSQLQELSSSVLGKAGLVEEKLIGEDKFIVVSECKEPRAATLLIRGGTDCVLDEVKRAVHDAIGDIGAAIESGKVLPGAGAVEIKLSKVLLEFAENFSGRERLAIIAFARALEVIPATLIENAGLDPITLLSKLKSANSKQGAFFGIDVMSGKVIEPMKAGIIEPIKIKQQALATAVEVTNMILRIDDIIINKPDQEEPPKIE